MCYATPGLPWAGWYPVIYPVRPQCPRRVVCLIPREVRHLHEFESIDHASTAETVCAKNTRSYTQLPVRAVSLELACIPRGRARFSSSSNLADQGQHQSCRRLLVESLLPLGAHLRDSGPAYVLPYIIHTHSRGGYWYLAGDTLVTEASLCFVVHKEVLAHEFFCSGGVLDSFQTEAFPANTSLMLIPMLAILGLYVQLEMSLASDPIPSFHRGSQEDSMVRPISPALAPGDWRNAASGDANPELCERNGALVSLSAGLQARSRFDGPGAEELWHEKAFCL